MRAKSSLTIHSITVLGTLTVFATLAGCENTSPEAPKPVSPAVPAQTKAPPVAFPPTTTASAPSQPGAATLPAGHPDAEIVEGRTPEGKLFRKGVIKDAEGKPVEHGLYTSWWDNGNKMAEGQNVNGKAEGLWTYWHENGRKKGEGHWIKGKVNGLWTYWYEDGQKKKEQFWVDDGAHGSYATWHPNGKQAEIGSFVDRRQDGKFISWDPEGNVIREALYVAGEMISETVVTPTTPDSTTSQPG